jgi:hypothetical protein
MQRDNEIYSEARGFLRMLALLFIGLKLTGFIAWPWIWILAPLWVPIAAMLLVVAFAWLALQMVRAVRKSRT